jgi:hypothetical protein
LVFIENIPHNKLVTGLWKSENHLLFYPASKNPFIKNSMKQIDGALLDFITTQVPLIISAVWYIARQKALLEKMIDAVKDSQEKQIVLLDKMLSLLTLDFHSFKSSTEEKIGGQGKRFQVKIERIEDKIIQAIKLQNIEKKVDYLVDKSSKD